MKNLCRLIMVVCVLGLVLPSNVMAAKADGKKAKLIAKYDKNGDGALDADEAAALRKDAENDKDGDLKAYDKDGDGKLSDEEITAIKPGAAKKPKNETAGEKPKKVKKEKKGKSESTGKSETGNSAEGSSEGTTPKESE